MPEIPDVFAEIRRGRDDIAATPWNSAQVNVYNDQTLPELREAVHQLGGVMPTKIVDLSARSEIIRDEPFHVHFWECTPAEYLEFLRSPRKLLAGIGIILPKECRVETTIENHDWLEEHTGGFTRDNGTIICNVGGGNVARAVYRVVSYAHDHSAVGAHKKKLLHSPEDQQVSTEASRK